MRPTLPLRFAPAAGPGWFRYRLSLLMLCRQRLDGFRAQRGEEVTGWLVETPAASATAAATALRSAAGMWG